MKIEITTEEFGSLLEYGTIVSPGVQKGLESRAHRRLQEIEELNEEINSLKSTSRFHQDRAEEFRHSHNHQATYIAELKSKLEEGQARILELESPPTGEPDMRSLRDKLYAAGFAYLLGTPDCEVRKTIKRWVASVLNGAGDEQAFDHIRSAGKFMAIVDEHFAQNPADPSTIVRTVGP